MRLKKTLSVASTVCLIALGYVVITYGQQNSSPAVYNPYPPGILPADLDSEIARVLREIDVIEGRAIKRWHSLPPPTRLEMRPGPNPPVLKDTGTESIGARGCGLQRGA
jgi:cytochrome c peroxidase